MSKNKTNDMTVGSPVKLIIQFMIPMFLGNVFQQFYNIVDSIVAGQFIGVDALAAIGSTGSLMFFVTGWLNGLSSGFAIIVAQRFGVQTGAFRNRENADRMLYQLTDQGYPSYILKEGDLFKVQTGAFQQLGNAINMEQRLRDAGYSTLIVTK